MSDKQKITFPIYLEQKCKGFTCWIMLECANRIYKVQESTRVKTINDSTNLHSGKGMVDFWLRQMHRQSSIKICREIDFLSAFQRVSARCQPPFNKYKQEMECASN